jgi:hypothetical protein
MIIVCQLAARTNSNYVHVYDLNVHKRQPSEDIPDTCFAIAQIALLDLVI